MAATTKAGQFSGRWIGETQGCEMPAHIWEIKQNGTTLQIFTIWEGQREPTGRPFWGTALRDQPGFTIMNGRNAILLDSQHFVIPGWDTNDARGGVGADYDVVFSRPGLAELFASEVWERWNKRKS